MYDQTILLKIKREFTTQEAVAQLLKIVSELELEFGVIKSERDEALFLLKKKQNGEAKTKKEWLKDELIEAMAEQVSTAKKNCADAKKDVNYWRNKYFSHLATENKTQVLQLTP